MQIDTEGTYLLKYTAEDECGNITEVTREVVAEVPITYRTVRYQDNTLIINEKSTDIDANVAEHGSALNVYPAFDPNGATDTEKYIFDSDHLEERPWDNVASSILSVEIGSNISPTSTESWFERFSKCLSFNLLLLDTSNVTTMERMFSGCAKVANLNLSNFDTSLVEDMSYMFIACRVLTNLDISSFNTSRVTKMDRMFDTCQAIQTIDVSSFDTSAVTDMTRMFYSCSALTTILASTRFVTSNVLSSGLMFTSSSQLVGGAGTVFNSSYINATYARIDNPPDAPGYFTLKSA